MHIRHFPIAVGSVQDPLVTGYLRLYYFLPARLKLPPFQWDLQELGISGYWAFCYVKELNISSRAYSKDLPGRTFYGGITAWDFFCLIALSGGLYQCSGLCMHG